MVTDFESRLLQGVACTVQWATIHGHDVLCQLRFSQQRFNAPANPRETRHLAPALLRQCARSAIGQFAGIGTTRACVDHDP